LAGSAIAESGGHRDHRRRRDGSGNRRRCRGYDVALLEQSDFGKGTSSRSTKLAHGGVRYLEQGNVSLVMEALQERGIMRRNGLTWCTTWRS